jgi:hypothetical protein
MDEKMARLIYLLGIAVLIVLALPILPTGNSLVTEDPILIPGPRNYYRDASVDIHLQANATLPWALNFIINAETIILLLGIIGLFLERKINVILDVKLNPKPIFHMLRKK